MTSAAAPFNSQHWYSDIALLADEYWTLADKTFVTYNKRFVDTVSALYSERLAKLKEDIFGKACPADKKIDRHKIIALHIQVLLEKPIFGVPTLIKEDHGSWPETKLINEMFCADIMCTILEVWGETPIDQLKFKEYYVSFLKILYYYREYCNAYCEGLYRNSSSFDKRNNLFTYKLAHLIYFIEKNFSKQSQE